ncbi:2-amino-4-hydroxy-6-hydroxymethyldihydropteridine diphosphokinase [Arcanobacterium urinimassiliense]|uniref:2-amino-4-hydroxy-6- hydroxymethyldihydropteridine diphosphokinase n=1 Tax=Arcanobacterium urinimassiliense TaxID=1871014 RepID=UPI0009403DC0|nr:2-amino-4-hydroxy-6-hydroxymethyldihydropteridine diphosphokinase [Arcanobacterium urinimassiliense]
MYADWITLKGVALAARHGVFAFEKARAQEFLVDISYQVITAGAIAADEIKQSISYADVAECARKIMGGESVNLIETLAHRIALEVLNLGARQVKVTVHKPQAPLEIEFQDVYVEVERQAEILRPAPRRYVIALGANLGDPARTLQQAMCELEKIADIKKCSSFYRTAPLLAPGQTPQPPYINAVLEAEFLTSPLEVLHKLQELEACFGRTRTERWGARLLDLDIITAGDITSNDPELQLPHPRAAQRRFVLEPWAEISPHAQLGGVPIVDLLAKVAAQEVEICRPQQEK